MTLSSIVSDAIESLEEWAKDNYPELDTDYDQAISEIADSAVPIYTASLLECALDCLWLATVEPENGPAMSGEPTAANIIAANLYEHVTEKLYKAWDDIKTEIESNPNPVTYTIEPTMDGVAFEFLNGVLPTWDVSYEESGTLGDSGTVDDESLSFWDALYACASHADDNGYETIIIEWKVVAYDLNAIADRMIVKQDARNTKVG